MSIVVTGATGQLGRLVLDALLTGDSAVPAESVAAVVRDKEKAADLAERGSSCASPTTAVRRPWRRPSRPATGCS